MLPSQGTPLLDHTIDARRDTYSLEIDRMVELLRRRSLLLSRGMPERRLAVLREQREALDRLIEEAQRLRKEVDARLLRLNREEWPAPGGTQGARSGKQASANRG